METRRFGATHREVPLIGQGTWNMERDDRNAAIDALRLGLDLGMTHVDTAEMYGSGAVEEMVGEAIQGRRNDVFLVSKVLPENASRKGTIAACERSLARLLTDRLDCYLLHWRGRYPLEETVAAFAELERDGKILSCGVSNFDVPDLEEIEAIAGNVTLACNQVLYHLRERAVEHAVLPWCEAHGLAVVAHTAHSVPAASRARTRPAGACSAKSPPNTARRLVRWGFASSSAGDRSSRSPKPRGPRMRPRTPGRETCD